jgi:DNA polymerase-1
MAQKKKDKKVDKRTKLGTIDNVDYYYNGTTGELEWRVPDIREAIRAEKGFKILGADYSQIEVKLVAALSKDQWLIAAINSGKDIHSYLATEVFGQSMSFDYETMLAAKEDEDHPRHSELSSLRSAIKAVVFGIIYGAGVEKVAEMTGGDKNRARDIMDAFFAKAHALKDWLDLQGKLALSTLFSTSPKGRKRFYAKPDPSMEKYNDMLGQIKRWSGNHPIQAGNVDMLKPALYGIYRDLRMAGIKPADARIIFIVHDEIVMTARDELVTVVENIMIDNMTKAYDALITGIANEIKVKVGDRWLK